MTYNIEILKEKNRASFVFSHINEKISKTGVTGYTDDTIRQIVVVLKQSLDTANIETVNKIEYVSSNKKLAVFIKSGGIYGLLVDAKTDVDFETAFVKEKVEEKPVEEDKSAKSKIVLKERKKISIKGGKKEEEEEEKEAPAQVPQQPSLQSSSISMDSSTFDNVKKVASEYLEDFSDDIINNLIHEMKLNVALMTSDDMEKFLKRLLNSSKLIIGPSQSQKMVDDIKKKIT